MTVHPGLRARDARAAAHTAVFILGVCATVVAGFTLLGPASVTAPLQATAWWSVVLLVVTCVVFSTVPPARLDRGGAFVVLGVAGVTVLCWLTIASGNASTAGQAFLAFAVLYAGFYLRALATTVVTAAALIGDAVLLFALSPREQAVTDLAFFGALLVLMAVLLVRSGNAQERMIAALRHQAGVDGLTGLVTRRVLDEALTAAMTEPGPGEGTALVLLDVDDFKGINDVHGHPVGDDALAHLAAIVTRSFRSGDAVVGRLGGDEIALLLPGCAPEAAARRAEHLLEQVRATPLALPDGTLLALSISLGVAHAPRHATGVRELYAAADQALYRAKSDGRGRVAVAA